MAPLLLLEPFAQCFHQLVEPAKRLDLGTFLFGEMLFGHAAQPVLRQVERFQNGGVGDRLESLEARRKGAVETVDMTLVLHHRGARQVVEPFHVIGDEAGPHGIEKRQEFAKRNRNTRAPQGLEEGQKHQISRVITMVNTTPASPKRIRVHRGPLHHVETAPLAT